MTYVMSLFASMFAPASVRESRVTVTMPEKKCRCCQQSWTAAQCTSEWTESEWTLGGTCEPCATKFWEGF